MYKDVLSGKECVGNEESAWWCGKERLGDVLPALYCDRSPTRMLPLNTPTLEEHESCPPVPSPPLLAVTKRQPLTRFCCILTQDFSARSFLSFPAPFGSVIILRSLSSSFITECVCMQERMLLLFIYWQQIVFSIAMLLCGHSQETAHLGQVFSIHV